MPDLFLMKYRILLKDWYDGGGLKIQIYSKKTCCKSNLMITQ